MSCERKSSTWKRGGKGKLNERCRTIVSPLWVSLQVLDCHIRQLTGLHPRREAERVGLGLGVHEPDHTKVLGVLRVCNPLDIPVAEKKSTLPTAGAVRSE